MYVFAYIYRKNTIMVITIYIGKTIQISPYRNNKIYIEKHNSYYYPYIYRNTKNMYIYIEKQSTFPAIKEKEKRYYYIVIIKKIYIYRKSVYFSYIYRNNTHNIYKIK